MKGLIRSSNPYLSIKPRSFFAERLAMLKYEQKMKKVGLNHYPKWKNYEEEKYQDLLLAG
jgi:hypothetical protein